MGATGVLLTDPSISNPAASSPATGAASSPHDRLAALLAEHPRPPRRATMRNGRAEWYRIVNHAGESALIYLYDEIGYWGTTAQAFIDELRTVTAPAIDLHINSPGGDVFDAVAIYSSLKAHPATVTTYIDGIAASAASFIAQAGDRVIMARNATMMIHDALAFTIGNEQIHLEQADLLGKISDNIADIYAQRAGGTVAEWRDQMRAESWYTGAEAVTAGLADQITDPDDVEANPADAVPEPATAADEDPMNRSWDLSIFTYAGRERAPAPVPVNRTAQIVAASTPVDQPATEPVVPAPAEVAPTDGESAPGGDDHQPGEDEREGDPAPESDDAPTTDAPATDSPTADGAPASGDAVDQPPAAPDAGSDDDPLAALASTWADEDASATPDWADLVGHLTEDPLARLREAYT